MNQVFQFDESANSPDLTDEEIASAVMTSSSEDAIGYLEGQDCVKCGGPFRLVRSKKLFRFPHFYSRMSFECPQGHAEVRLLQVTWIYGT
jgi:hypothetical protein